MAATTPDAFSDYTNPAAGAAQIAPAVMLSCLFVLLLFRTAWLCDDAFISFRVVDNLVSGHGLTWNPGERVQVFTNPLWTLLMALVYSVTGEMYLTPIFVSVACSLAAFAIVLTTPGAAIPLRLVIGGALLCSTAFVEYSTSGLENPLAYLLAALFWRVYFTASTGVRRAVVLSILAALSAVNRLDTVLLFAPALAFELLRERKLTVLGGLATGQLPLLAWLLFALVYFGFPLPNTYYAKLHTAIPQGEYSVQGLHYLLDTAEHDPVTFALVVLGLVLPLCVSPRAKSVALALGVAAYLLYTIRVGGDFMRGRFFALPALCAAAGCLASLPPRFTPNTVLAALMLLTVMIAAGTPYVLRPYDERVSYLSPHYIADERRVYVSITGLKQHRSGLRMPEHPWAVRGRELGRQPTGKAAVEGTVGMMGFAAGPAVRFVDVFGLADPLLARLPANKPWRIGHFERRVPYGYADSVATGENRLAEPGLREYYDLLRHATQGPLLSAARWRAIWRLNTGSAESLLSNPYALAPLKLAETPLIQPKPPGTPWHAEGTLHPGVDGVTLLLDRVHQNPQLEISFDNNDQYEIAFLLNGREIEKIVQAPLPGHFGGGLRPYRIAVPGLAVQSGFDALRIRPLAGDERYSIGHVLLLESEQATGAEVNGEVMHP